MRLVLPIVITIIVLLLIVIIILMVIGFVRKNKRKNDQDSIPTYPNPVYYNNQGKYNQDGNKKKLKSF